MEEAILPDCELKEGGLEVDSGEEGCADGGDESGFGCSGGLDVLGEGGCWGWESSMVTKAGEVVYRW